MNGQKVIAELHVRHNAEENAPHVEYLTSPSKRREILEHRGEHVLVADEERPLILKRIEEGGIWASSIARKAPKPVLVRWRSHAAHRAPDRTEKT